MCFLLSVHHSGVDYQPRTSPAGVHPVAYSGSRVESSIVQGTNSGACCKAMYGMALADSPSVDHLNPVFPSFRVSKNGKPTHISMERQFRFSREALKATVYPPRLGCPSGMCNEESDIQV